MQETLDYLKTSLEDKILSKAEKKALKSILAEKNLSKDDLNRLRSDIFNAARDHFSEFKHQQILDWLEEANKLILPKATPSFYCKSYFSPGPDCANAIMNQISYAVNTIDICVFTISDNDLRDKIEYALGKKVKVRIITDNEKTLDLGSDIEYLFRKGASIKIDTTRHHMHHKFAIFDKSILLTGSYNWTRSAAQYNQENILETNDPKVLNDYQNEFNRLWETMEDYYFQ